MFKTDTKFFDEFAKAATGAVGALSGVRQQIQNEIKTQINRFIVEMDFVPREDFEIVEAMAREARLQNEKLAARVTHLEKLAGVSAAVKSVKKTAPKKTSAKKATPAQKSAKKKK
jgi:BMFP domain-containing protein YqiC